MSPILPIAHIAQESLLCVPTSAAMILAYYGDPQSPRKLKALAATGRYDPDHPFDDFSITFYREIVAAVRRLGYDWRELSLPDDDSGFDEGMRMIAAELDRGRPVMIDLSIPQGHTVIVAGLDSKKQVATLIDPAQPAPGTVPFPLEWLRSSWNERAYGGDFRSLILTGPRRP